jgi:hypothetical protein
MPKGILFVESSPSAPEREAEFNNWYNDTHLIDVLKLSGFTAARRFRKLGDSGHSYAAIYEVEGDDLQGALATLGAAVQAGDVPISDVLAQQPAPNLVLYEEIYERQS